MVDSAPEEKIGVSAMELLSIAGFAFLIGWMFVQFFWLFCDFPSHVPVSTRDFTQMWAFIGIPVGYVALHLLGRLPRFNVFSTPCVSVELVFAVALPIATFAMYNGALIPLPVVCTLNFLAGAAFAGLNLSWLDVCSRLKTTSYGRFTGLAYAGGTLLFALAAVSPESMQPAFIFIYVLCSVGLLVFATARADGNDERAPLEATADTWKFSKEVEPSLFMYGVVFALTFVFLFNFGPDYVFIGLLFALPGALAIALLSITHHEIGITSIQRILTFVAVAACVITPFATEAVQLACACVVVAAWAALVTVNCAFLVKKSTFSRETPFFRQSAMRLSVQALGFAAGWVVAAVATMIVGAHAGVFTTIRLIAVVVLVAVVMLFLPVEKHHNADGTSSADAQNGATTVLNVSMSEAELFEARCDAIAKLYQLSPRETDILRYLARGRNAAYLQEKFTISPHTVKSHIYNIYRKLDIHSQQKLMDFVEEFPLEDAEVRKG